MNCLEKKTNLNLEINKRDNRLEKRNILEGIGKFLKGGERYEIPIPENP